MAAGAPAFGGAEPAGADGDCAELPPARSKVTRITPTASVKDVVLRMVGGRGARPGGRAPLAGPYGVIL